MSIAHHRLSLLFVAVLATSYLAYSQQEGYIAIIPTFHDRLNTSDAESTLKLQRQRFILFAYRNAVAVFSEASFINVGSDTVSQELALPSTGHDENGEQPGGRLSSGILSVRLWEEGERIVPDLISDGDEDWYTIRARFAPGEQRIVRAMFWTQTSLTDVDSLPGLDTVSIAIGKRGFMVDLAHANVWNSVVEDIEVTVVLKGEMSFQQDSFSAEPDIYDLQDSTISWSLINLEPSQSDNIVALYTPSKGWGSTTNTMAKLSAYIVKRVYGDLLNYAKQVERE